MQFSKFADSLREETILFINMAKESPVNLIWGTVLMAGSFVDRKSIS